MASLHDMERFAYYLACATVDNELNRATTIRNLMRRKQRLLERIKVDTMQYDCIIIIHGKRKAAAIEHGQRQMFG